jgi:oxidoreductase
MAEPKATKSALILGATGQTGRYLLHELIASPTFTRVCEAGRRVTSTADLPARASGKLEQKVIDFERLDESGLNLKEGKWDVVFVACVARSSVTRRGMSVLCVALCRLGTTAKAAGSSENFTKIDREYVERRSHPHPHPPLPPVVAHLFYFFCLNLGTSRRPQRPTMTSD